MRPFEWMGRWLTRTHHSLKMPGLLWLWGAWHLTEGFKFDKEDKYLGSNWYSWCSSLCLEVWLYLWNVSIYLLFVDICIYIYNIYICFWHILFSITLDTSWNLWSRDRATSGDCPASVKSEKDWAHLLGHIFIELPLNKNTKTLRIWRDKNWSTWYPPWN